MRKLKKASFNWSLLAVAIVVVYFSSVLISQQSHLNQVGRSQAIADRRMDAAVQENERLKKEISELNDISNIERIAREELGMTKKGEMPYNTVWR